MFCFLLLAVEIHGIHKKWFHSAEIWTIHKALKIYYPKMEGLALIG
jgi:hypothetical protein